MALNPSELDALVLRVAEFVKEEVIPAEQPLLRGTEEPSDELRRELNAKARAAGLLAPQASVELGGLGLGHVERAAVFEAAGYSTLGPHALHCAAPDEGNMHMLDIVASPEQRERWLAPLVGGARSAFFMTEPGGAGADPNQLKTFARRDGGEFVITGRKWLISGAEGADIAIILANVVGEGGGPTMFLAPGDAPGLELIRPMRTAARDAIGGHWLCELDGVRVPEADVLGEVGQAFRYAQVRLAPARLTHCMRWLGAAQRAHDIATVFAARRTSFGMPLIKRDGVGFMLADNEMDMFAARQVIRRCAELLDEGADAKHETSMAKVICSEAIYRVADRAVQILGGAGATDETIVHKIYHSVRPFRIYDGPSEVHRWSIARHIARHVPEDDFLTEPIERFLALGDYDEECPPASLKPAA